MHTLTSIDEDVQARFHLTALSTRRLRTLGHEVSPQRYFVRDPPVSCQFRPGRKSRRRLRTVSQYTEKKYLFLTFLLVLYVL